MNRARVPARSNSGEVIDLAIAVVAEATTPSIPVRVMKSCMLGVSLNGTASLDMIIGIPTAKAGESDQPTIRPLNKASSPGSISVMYIKPVFLLKWKRLGARFDKQQM
jgi:hypothetical protein